MDPKPKLIVLAHSESWCSAIRRNLSTTKTSWVLDPDGLIDASVIEPGVAAIVEIGSANTADICKNLFQLSNNSTQMRLFAVGDTRLLKWSPLLRACGFSAWYWSLLQVPDLAQAIEKHRTTVRTPELSIESKVWSSLPWPGAATEGQA